MGRTSTKENKNSYQLAREELGLTREKASELLETIAPERIEKNRERTHRAPPRRGADDGRKVQAPVAVQLLLLAAVPYRPAVRTVCHAARAAGHHP